MRRLIGLLLLLPLACGLDRQPEKRDPVFSQRSAITEVCAAGATVDGIDVSTWQGTIDWDAVAGSGLAFAITRISDGTGYFDDQFDRNWGEIKRVGLVRGAYQFFEPGEDAAAQANLVVSTVGQLGPGDLPVTLDVEVATPTPDEIQTWVNIVSAGTGKTPMIYTSWGLWNSWIPGGGFGSLPLWAANYGVSCPGLASGWGNWTFWQWGDNAHIPGISGNVDGDHFNGSLSDLQNFAGSDQAPHGYLDSVGCDQLAGWSQDPDSPDQAVNVLFSFNGAALTPGASLVNWTAGDSRSDLCSALGSCNHAFFLPTPRGVLDGAAHEVHAYGLDAQGGGQNAELVNSPATLTCSPPTETGVRRHVTDPTSYAAWGFDGFQDQLTVSDATFASYAAADPLPAQPQLVQAAGDPAVYLVDGPFRRHVPSPAAMAAWHFAWSAIQPIDAAQLQAMPQGPDVRPRPQLLKASGPEIDVLDDPLPSLDPAPVDAGSPAPVDAGAPVPHAPDAGASTGPSPSADAGAPASTPPLSLSDGGAAMHAATSGPSGSHPAPGPGLHRISGCQGGAGGLNLLALGVAIAARSRRARMRR